MAGLWSLAPNAEDLTHLHLLAVLRGRFITHDIKQVFSRKMILFIGKFIIVYGTTVKIYFLFINATRFSCRRLLGDYFHCKTIRPT